MTHIEDLPDEILEQIITYLPPKTRITLSKTNKKFNKLTTATGWKHHYIKDFPENSNTGQLIKDSHKHINPAWHNIYKKEYETKKHENKKKQILMEHWKKQKTWYKTTHFHTIKDITNELCKEKPAQQNIQRTTNRKKKTTHMPQFKFQKHEAQT